MKSETFFRDRCVPWVVVALVTGIAVLQGAAINIIFVAKPQFAGNSCRSYAMALAAGTMTNSPVPVDTVAELRAAEKDLQLRLESTAKKMGPPNTPSSHAVWKRAVEEMTSGTLEAVVEYAPTGEA